MLLGLARRVDRPLFLVFSASAVAYVGALFVGRALAATGGAWSAPSDDALVHFDVARAAARGFPLQWSEGNGLATADGSLTYPLVLALGYRTAWPGPALMAWALVVASVSIVVFFTTVGSVFDRVGRGAKYALPPFVLGVGGVASALASGAETALFLGALGGALAATLHVEAGAVASRSKSPPWMNARALVAGLACMALVLTRPEAIVAVLAFAVFAGIRSRSLGVSTAFGVGGIVALPALLSLSVVALVTFDRTGEWLPTGRVARLLWFDPALDAPLGASLGPDARVATWWAHVRALPGIVASRVFAGGPASAVPLALALVPFADRRVRRYACLLGAIVVLFVPVVALASDPATDVMLVPMVALLLVLSALGFAIVCAGFGATTRARALWGVRVSVAALAILWFEGQHLPLYREAQRAYAQGARAIHEGPAAAGVLLANADPAPRRVLVAHPGAVPYFADRPAIDARGIGAYRDLPFARAWRSGVGAVLELVERLPDVDRPDVMTLAASDAPDLLLLFGRYINEVHPADGDRWLIYRTDWHALDRWNRPRTLEKDDRLMAQVDVGDPFSEREHAYRSSAPTAVSFHVLTDSERDDLFDAGRTIDVGVTESFDVDLPIGGGRLVARTAALAPAKVRVTIDGRDIGELEVLRSDAWSEPSIELPIGLPRRGRVALTPVEGAWVDYHLWLVATP